MKERPILFSGEMVRAILDGRKTMTRRVCKDQTPVRYWFGEQLKLWPDGKKTYTGWVKDILKIAIGLPTKCPYGSIGDHLWVRETWQHHPAKSDFDAVVYRATHGSACQVKKWKPSIFMPRWASRITLEITNVRFERLQEITEEDAKREGVEVLNRPEKPFTMYGSPACGDTPPYWHNQARTAFELLWDSINGKKYPWSSNPWVWVIEFKRINATTS